MSKNKLVLAIVGLFVLVLAACSNSDDYEYLSLVTGGSQGTYYALGGSFAEFISEETGIKTTAEVSNASSANVTALQEGNAEIAFVQSDIAFYAKNGEQMFADNKVEDIMAVGGLYPETVQLVTTKSSGITSFADLKGKKVSVGAPGSGTLANAEQLLEIHGLSLSDIDAQNLDFGESTDGLSSGQIDAAFITSGYPTGAVEGLNATTEIVIVPVEPAKADELIAKYPYYTKDAIVAGTYGLTEDVPAVSVLAMIIVKEELPEDIVYDITKAIYTNTDKISHARGANIKIETALDGVGIDVHPGAQKFYDEQ
jgi:uncharacterized protein